MTDRAVALVRYGQKYGIRTMLKDAEAVHRELHPDQPFENVAVHSVYEVRPLPHGMQTAGIRDLLKQWGWKAKPLQPFRADQMAHWIRCVTAGQCLSDYYGRCAGDPAQEERADQDQPGDLELGQNQVPLQTDSSQA